MKGTKIYKFLVSFTCCGIFLRGITSNKVQKMLIYVYIAAIHFWALFICGDILYIIIATKVPFLGLIYFSFEILANTSPLIKSLYFIVNNSSPIDILNYWNSHFKFNFRSELRERHYDTQLKRAWRVFVSAMLSLPMCYVAMTTLGIAQGELFIPSWVMGDFNSLKAPIWLILVQGLSIVLNLSIWAATEGFLSLILNITIAELKYLNDTLSILLCYHGAKKFTNSELRIILGKWITHHCELIRFHQLVKQFFSPFLACQFFYLTLFGCGFIFSALTVEMTAMNAVLCVSYISTVCIFTLIACRDGDQIEILSKNLCFTSLSTNFWDLPLDIKKVLRFISVRASEPLTLDFHRLVKLDCHTFHQMNVLQYQLFTFLQETTKNRQV